MLRNFDSSTSRFLASVRKKARTKMFIMAILCFLLALLGYSLKPPGVDFNVRFFMCIVVFVATFNMFDRLLGMIKEYISEDRQKVEEEISSRILYMKHMTEKGTSLSAENPGKIQ